MTDSRSLQSLNTLGLPVKAREVHSLRHPGAVQDWREGARHMGLPRLVLGGGSNVVFTGDFPGSVGVVRIPGMEYLGADRDSHYVQAGSGENWHKLVQWTLAHDLPGLENLSLIPGSVGAAPMQNIGAYGVELADRFESLDAIDLESGERRLFTREECRFGYRDSRFKREPDRWLITRVLLKLPRHWEPVLDYAGLREHLAAGERPDAETVGRAVCEIRRSKLPDPTRLGNVGSFFKNPVVGDADMERLASSHPDLPRWDVEDGHKLSAGWLIEQCGWKGKRQGAAGVHERHALVLVNHGGASGAEIWQLARDIRNSVADRFGIGLEPEPRIVGPEDESRGTGDGFP